MDKQEVRQIRHKLGMTQERFALVTGAALTTVRRWEYGISRPSKAYLRILERLNKGEK